MKPHPRIRKTVKWGGVVVSVVLMVVWVGSGRYEVIWTTENWGGATLEAGQVGVANSVYVDETPPEPPWFVGARIRPLRWWFDGMKIGRAWYFAVPLWFPLTLSLMATAAAWRLDVLARNRARVGLCPKCHYDMHGLAPGAKCPECGA